MNDFAQAFNALIRKWNAQNDAHGMDPVSNPNEIGTTVDGVNPSAKMAAITESQHLPISS